MDGQQLIRRAARLGRCGAIAGLVMAIVAGPAVAVLGHRAGWQLLIERSASMAPTVAAGDLLVVQRERAEQLRRGDVVTFADPHVGGRTLTHRVVAVRTLGDRLAVTTRGDANRAAEHWSIARVGTVARLRTSVGLPPVASSLLDRSHVRGMIMALLSLLACGLTLWAIWRRPAAPCVPAR
jgi:signal peptidase I